MNKFGPFGGCILKGSPVSLKLKKYYVNLPFFNETSTGGAERRYGQKRIKKNESSLKKGRFCEKNAPNLPFW